MWTSGGREGDGVMGGSLVVSTFVGRRYTGSLLVVCSISLESGSVCSGAVVLLLFSCFTYGALNLFSKEVWLL